MIILEVKGENDKLARNFKILIDKIEKDQALTEVDFANAQLILACLARHFEEKKRAERIAILFPEPSSKDL